MRGLACGCARAAAVQWVAGNEVALVSDPIADSLAHLVSLGEPLRVALACVPAHSIALAWMEGRFGVEGGFGVRVRVGVGVGATAG